MRKLSLAAALIVFIALLSACRWFWSADEKAILKSYEVCTSAFVQRSSSVLFSNLSSNTQEFLDTLSVAFKESGFSFGCPGREFLGTLLATTDFINLAPMEVDSIEVSGNTARLYASSDSCVMYLVFLREDDSWKLDMEESLRASYVGSFREAGTSLEDLFAGKIDADGVMWGELGLGYCPIIIENGLEGCAISYVGLNPSDERHQRLNLLADRVLSPGGEFTIWVDPGVYDLLIEDELGRTAGALRADVATIGGGSSAPRDSATEYAFGIFELNLMMPEAGSTELRELSAGPRDSEFWIRANMVDASSLLEHITDGTGATSSMDLANRIAQEAYGANATWVGLSDSRQQIVTQIQGMWFGDIPGFGPDLESAAILLHSTVRQRMDALFQDYPTTVHSFLEVINNRFSPADRELMYDFYLRGYNRMPMDLQARVESLAGGAGIRTTFDNIGQALQLLRDLGGCYWLVKEEDLAESS
jgi:hypothetical protein